VVACPPLDQKSMEIKNMGDKEISERLRVCGF